MLCSSNANTVIFIKFCHQDKQFVRFLSTCPCTKANQMHTSTLLTAQVTPNTVKKKKKRRKKRTTAINQWSDLGC
jgi:hypothetical protein